MLPLWICQGLNYVVFKLNSESLYALGLPTENIDKILWIYLRKKNQIQNQDVRTIGLDLFDEAPEIKSAK